MKAFLLSLILIAVVQAATITCESDPILDTIKVFSAAVAPFCASFIASTATVTKTTTRIGNGCASTAGSTITPTVPPKPSLPPVIDQIALMLGPRLSSSCTCLIGTNGANTYTATASAFVYSPAPTCATVNLRIEGASSTIFEGPISSGPRNITTSSGGTHLCNGKNNGANLSPGATCTTALDEAAKLNGFSYDATFSTTYDDFFITSIGDSPQTSSQFWGLLVNYQFTDVGGCQYKVQKDDEVLWAYDAFNANAFLKLSGRNKVKAGAALSVKVVDGKTNAPVAGALVGGITTGADGVAMVTLTTKGTTILKATKAGAVRSNALAVVVS